MTGERFIHNVIAHLRVKFVSQWTPGLFDKP